MASAGSASVAPAAASASVAPMGSELRYLLEQASVPQNMLAKLAELGVGNVEVFAALADSPADFREFAKAALGVDPGESVHKRILQAKSITAWESARCRGAKRRAAEAEAHVHDLPKKLPKSVHLELRRAYGALHSELRDTALPHAD